MRCPFCHNSALVTRADEQKLYSNEEVLAFLKKRQGILDGVAITGGEPTLAHGLAEFLEQVRVLGYKIKLDTNGTRPEVLKNIVSRGLVDYVAMDIKNCPERYCETAGMDEKLLASVEKSAAYLLSGAVDYELRTTVMDELHDEAGTEQMGQWLRKLCPDHKIKRFFLQPYVDRESVLVGGFSAPSNEKLEKMAKILASFSDSVSIRAMD